MNTNNNLSRRDFLTTTGTVIAGSVLASPMSVLTAQAASQKTRLALVGTGIRGTTLWGKTLKERYGDTTEFVGLCDINKGRMEYAKKYIGVNCGEFLDFEQMVKQTKPDTVIVTTMDSTHHQYIIKALEMGCNVITEKPMTTDETKCQAILDAEKRTGRKVVVTFNYRYAPHSTRIKELLIEKSIGDIVSVDFHWYLNCYHGASYFRRWHGLRNCSGTLLCHKSTHHFDLLNWWIDSDPEEVYAYGDLEFYGHNNAFRAGKCRGCPHKSTCKFYWDITKNKRCMDLYVANEQYDGYIRDACLWRNAIDIYDKMAVQIRYANNVFVSYSLTTYSPYEGWRIAFNGTKGRMDSWQDIPWMSNQQISQADLHAAEMDQDLPDKEKDYNEIMVMENFGKPNLVKVPKAGGGHGGGDIRMQNMIFKNPNAADPLKHSAGTRDGAMSVLLGVAARKSIEEKRPVMIAELTDLEPMAIRPV